MLVFSSDTTCWYGARSGSGSTGCRFMTRASIRSMTLRAWSWCPLTSSQRGDSGSRQAKIRAMRMFSPASSHR